MEGEQQHQHQHQQQERMTNTGGGDGVGGLQLPPGFRFHPTDEEIIVFCLMPKALDASFNSIAIGEVNLNKSEPWELPEKAKMGEKEWYFYCQRDRKYPTGMRTNRATEAGYWKATGKDKRIYRTANMPRPELVGMKKTLVFYKGRAPRGDKTNWVMHEYRLDGSSQVSCPAASSSSNTTGKSSSSSSKDEWVVCRIFHKSSGVNRALPLPAYNMTNLDQGSSSFPMPMQFNMAPEDFAVDCNALRPLMDQMVASFYPTAGASSSSAPPLVPSLPGLVSSVFGNMMTPAQPMPSFYQQMDMGTGENASGGFLVTPESRPSSMVSQQDDEMSPDQTNTTRILSSVVHGAPSVATNIDVDCMWKY